MSFTAPHGLRKTAQWLWQDMRSHTHHAPPGNPTTSM